jgi:hypothetical protein
MLFLLIEEGPLILETVYYLGGEVLLEVAFEDLLMYSGS